jgi:GntR family transcriptional regulator of vanillate catabolism
MEDGSRQSQTLKAVLGLRGRIIDGLIPAGGRVSEAFLVKEFGVSRTPARVALMRLKEEGLLETLPSGGFVVSGFSMQDVSEAIEIRGTLEGMAARYAAERGAPTEILLLMDDCVDKLDVVINNLTTAENLDGYVELNDRFHELLIDAAQSSMLKRSIERVLTLPFAAPNAFVRSSQTDFPGIKNILLFSNEQHRCIVDAIRNREGTRAQSIAIEHSRSAWKYLKLALAGQSFWQTTDLSLVHGLGIRYQNKVGARKAAGK